MIKRWRLKVPPPIRYINWCEFELSIEGRCVLEDLNAKIYPMAEVIVFHSIEDLLVFKLKVGLP